MASKKRLDLVLVENGLVPSRQKAQALIMAGRVLVEDQVVDKPGTAVYIDTHISIRVEDSTYVSRGGLKLEAAIRNFGIEVEGKICLDVGASTGGFTDCLLQHGARHVYAVDVGYGQLAWKLRQDARVTVIERTNIRHMPSERIPQPMDLISVDVSFISLKLVVPEIKKFLAPGGHIIALIKPQFEVGKGKVGKGGVVRDVRLHGEVIEMLTHCFHELGFRCSPAIPSPILGPKGNQEFIILIRIADCTI